MEIEEIDKKKTSNFNSTIENDAGETLQDVKFAVPPEFENKDFDDKAMKLLDQMNGDKKIGNNK